MSKILLLVSLLAAPALLCAQTATDHFHRGAQYYVFGDKTNAMMEVVTGLQKFPDDEPLQSLAEILRKQEQQQQQQSQQNQEQQQKESDKQEQQQQAQQDQKEQQQQSQEKKEQQKQDQEKSKSSTGEEKDKQDQKDEPAQSEQAHAMTPQEARQLLDAQKGDEQVLQFRPQGEPQRRDKKLKDW